MNKIKSLFANLQQRRKILAMASASLEDALAAEVVALSSHKVRGTLAAKKLAAANVTKNEFRTRCFIQNSWAPGLARNAL